MSLTWLAALTALALGALGGGPSAPPAQPDVDRQVQNLRQFAKLYGYVRYFHPSDEASALDWDQFAAHGAARVKAAGAAAELRALLVELFSPVAPSLQVFATGQMPPPVPASGRADEHSETILWQHLGYGPGPPNPAYRSARVVRPPARGWLSFSGFRSNALFSGGPRLGDTISRDLGGGVSVRLPLALPRVKQRAVPAASADAVARLARALSPATAPRAGTELDLEEGGRLAGVVIAWNALQHFYPYFDVVGVNWDRTLTTALQRALTDRTRADHLRSLRWLVAQLQDGHADVRDQRSPGPARLPWQLDWVEDQPVVVAAATGSGLRPGDVPLTLDGRSVVDLLAAEEALISGSPQWKRQRALALLGTDATGNPADLLVRRGSGTLALLVPRQTTAFAAPALRPSLQVLAGGYWYVDLTRAAWPDIAARLDTIATAPGVIFDLRGYPNGNDAILGHLLDRRDQSDRWMCTPKIAYPDRERPIECEYSGWALRPRHPRIRGRVAFITGPTAISYSESVMSFVEHYRLGTIVGRSTAGTNGNIVRLALPGAFQVVFTGMRVLKHDGSRLHLVGIRPERPAAATIEGVRAGRDEAFEAALDTVRTGRGAPLLFGPRQGAP